MPTQPTKSMQDLWQDSYLAPGNESYLEDLYESYLTNPQSVGPEWRHYFDHLLQTVPHVGAEVSHAAVREEFAQLAKQPRKTIVTSGVDANHLKQQERVIELITAYRRLGHLQADIDPLRLQERIATPTLDLSYY